LQTVENPTPAMKTWYFFKHHKLLGIKIKNK